MKKLLLLLLAVGVVISATGCAPKEEEPVTNPTNEKPADDKAAAGHSGEKKPKDMEVKSQPVADVNAGAKPPVKDAATLEAEENERKLNPEKPADDAPVKMPPQVKDVPPPGTPIEEDKG